MHSRLWRICIADYGEGVSRQRQVLGPRRLGCEQSHYVGGGVRGLKRALILIITFGGPQKSPHLIDLPFSQKSWARNLPFISNITFWGHEKNPPPLHSCCSPRPTHKAAKQSGGFHGRGGGGAGRGGPYGVKLATHTGAQTARRP